MDDMNIVVLHLDSSPNPEIFGDWTKLPAYRMRRPLRYRSDPICMHFMCLPCGDSGCHPWCFWCRNSGMIAVFVGGNMS